jgi:ankyrin repeat protein
VEQYKKLAKDLVRIAKSGDSAALSAWAKRWVEALVKLCGLTIPPDMPVRVDQWAAQVEEFARSHLAGSAGKPGTLAGAQFALARLHGFDNWPAFVSHIEDLRHSDSTTSNFEAAAEAIVNGDENALLTYLQIDLELVRARSTREHYATLLHYVAANGVEGWRQKTPPNIVEIAADLLDAGAEVDAVAQIYGGSTTLGLAATSIHPQRAGVQIALLQLLLDRGARMDRNGSAGNRQSLVKACLANGRGQAAEFLAARAAALDLESAAGVGAIDTVRSFFDTNGKLRPDASDQQLSAGFLWACQFGRNRVVEFLIDRGIDLTALDRNGQSALHHAVIGAQLETVKLLLKNGAPLELKNVYGGTPLGQALWSAYNSDPARDYVPIIEALIEAGAKIEPDMEDALARLLMRRQPTH